MKFTLSWLKEHLDTNATLEEIATTLTNIGLEVDETEDRSQELKSFNTVLVEKCEKHSESDHLNICTVKTHDNQTLQIICGAPNAKTGMKAILAPVGSILPNNLKITKAKIRGIESNGMLCSDKELGISEETDGIIELDPKTKLGTNIADIYNLNDPLIEIDITPNKGDCLGVYGIARDLAAAGLGTLKELHIPNIKSTVSSPIRLETNDENCPCFGFRYIKNVKNCESPEWLKNKLISIGLTPISALVDITNYVLFDINKSLHCYDADKIKGHLNVRSAKDKERFTALDENTHILSKGMTVIADDTEALCLGGIMGGLNSGASMQTKNIILESAIFNPINTAKTSKLTGLASDSSYRFERGVDSKSIEISLNIATKLILDICGGETSEIIKQCKLDKTPKIIKFNIKKIKTLLGVEIPRKNIIKILKDLGFEIQENTDDLNILNTTVPTWRNDVNISEDIVEEVGRIYGYNNLPDVKILNEKKGINLQNLKNKSFYDKLWQAKLYLASQGMDEVISYAFMKKELAKEFAPFNQRLEVKNPMSTELSYMRPSLIPNLLTILQRNKDRGSENLCLFEKGRVFIGQKPEDQKRVLAGVRSGKNSNKDIHNSSREYDVFDIKKDLLSCLEIFGIASEALEITREAPDYYHPQKSGAIKLGKHYLACFGEIHPAKIKVFNLKNRVNAFELFLDEIPSKENPKQITAKKKFEVSGFQAVERDFAFILDKQTLIGKVLKAVKNTNKELIQDINLFDIYEGDNIDKNKKSIAFRVILQPKDKTLLGQDIELISNKIIQKITEKFNGVLRDQ